MTEAVDFVTIEYPDGSQRVDMTRLTDGRVMCCLCFEYVTRDQLTESDIPGCVTDVCRPCAAAEKVQTAALDARLGRAAQLVIEANLGAASFVQRQLGIRFSEAAYLMDRLEAAGVVGSAAGSRAREVLVTFDEAMVLLANG